MTSCPDHETLAAFLEARLPESEQRNLESHAVDCPDCLDVIAAALPDATTGAVRSDEPVTRLNTHAAPAPRGWPRAIAAGLALLATCGLGYVTMGRATEYVRVAAVRMAADRLGATVAVEHLRLALTPDLRSITVSAWPVDLGWLGRAAALEIVLTPGSLALGTPVLHSLRLLAPEFHVSLSDDDPDRLRPADAVGALALAPTVEIIDAVLQLDRPNGETLRVEHLSAIARTIGTRVEVAATGTMAGGTLTLRGTLETQEPQQIDATIGGRDLPSAMLPYLSDWVEGRTTLAIRVTGNPRRLRWGGRLHVVDTQFPGFRPPLMLNAILRSNLHTVAEAADATAELRATFRADARGWRVPRSIVVQGAFETRAIVRSRVGERLSGTGMTRLPPGPSRELVERYPLLGHYGTSNGSLAFPFRLDGTSGNIAIILGP